MQKDEKLEQIQNLVGEQKVIFAPQYRVRLLKPWLDKIRKSLHVKSWWISDQSTIGDFGLNNKKLQVVRDELGVEVSHKDYLVDLAERLKNHEKSVD